MTGNSCLGCPSYITAEANQAQVTRYQVVLGAPICAQFGKLLGTPNMSEEEIIETAAINGRDCQGFGKPRPGVSPERPVDLNVMLPNPTVGKPNHYQPTRAVSCTGCKYIISSDKVRDVTGFRMPMCQVKGDLLRPTMTLDLAQSCDFATIRTDMDPTADFEGMRQSPHLAKVTFIETEKVDVTAAYRESKANFVDPTEYETDAEVTEEERLAGIRAWRRVTDPEGSGNSVMLPIFRLDYFTEIEQAKVPRTGDDEHPEEYVDHQGIGYKAAVLWRELDETPALHGVAGTGKTEFFRYMAWLMCLPFERISITNSTEIDDIAGKMLFENGETKFEMGRIPLAWSRPCVLCVDEPNVGPPEVWQFIRPLTDNSKQLVLDMAKGQRISRHEHVYFGMAMNPAWDMRNVGAQQISDADGSRLMHIFVGLPSAELEREILVNRCKIDGYDLPKDKLDMLMKVAADLRGLADQSTIPVTWGIRPQIKVARALRWFNAVSAYNLAAADYLDPEAKEAILDVVKSHDATAKPKPKETRETRNGRFSPHR